jgi:hypothetical protein
MGGCTSHQGVVIFRPLAGRFLKGRHLLGLNQAYASLGDPIAFFNSLQIISRT